MFSELQQFFASLLPGLWLRFFSAPAETSVLRLNCVLCYCVQRKPGVLVSGGSGAAVWPDGGVWSFMRSTARRDAAGLSGCLH